MKYIITVAFVLVFSLNLFAQTNYPPESYELDGTILVKWKGAEKEIDMKADANLQEITGVGSKAFENRKALKAVIFPNTLTEIGNQAFKNCHSLSNITLPESLITIGNSVFLNCKSLKTIHLPEGLIKIGNSAFHLCTSLDSIVIPATLTDIGRHPFTYCSSLSSINVKEDNPKYCSIGGVLFDKDKTVLMCYPAGKSDNFYTSPQSVTRIWFDAFIDCSSLATIILSENLTKIDNSAFEDCSALHKMICYAVIPPSLGNNVFENIAKDAVLYVPEESIEKYNDDPEWSQAFDIQAITDVGMGSYDQANISVWSSRGEVYMQSDRNVDARIYNLAGQQLYSGKVMGEKAVMLPTGIYIVKIDNKSYKISHR